MMDHSVPILTFIALLFVSAHCDAQQRNPNDEQKSKSAGSDAPVEVFYLRYMPATEAATMIDRFVGSENELSIVIAERLNALFIQGAKPPISQKIHDLLKAADVPAENAKELDSVKMMPNVFQKPNDIAATIRAMGITDVSIATGPDGTLIIKGAQKSVDSVQKLIETINQQANTVPSDISIELFWLTEGKVEGAIEFESSVIKQLADRGFKELSVLSELEVSTTVGDRCTASGGALSGEISAQIATKPAGNGVSVELDVEATHQVSEKRLSGIQFSTKITVSLDRFVIFGVARRDESEAPGNGSSKLTRDLFLLRVKKQESLAP